MLYLPVLVMGVLALGTYWLVRSTPVSGPQVPERVRGHEPDYFMHGFKVKTFDATGRLRSEVAGDVAEDGFGNDHALRAAKTAKSRVALRVGFAAVRRDADVF